MRKYDYTEPFEDEELEARALRQYEEAREQGSTVEHELLMQKSREMAHEQLMRLQALANEPVPVEDDEA
jgi:hypothetical protein